MGTNNVSRKRISINKIDGATQAASRQAGRAARAVGRTVKNTQAKIAQALAEEQSVRERRRMRWDNMTLRNEDMKLQLIYLSLRLAQVAIRVAEGYLLYTAGKYMGRQQNFFVRLFGRTLRLLGTGCIIAAAVIKY